MSEEYKSLKKQLELLESQKELLEIESQALHNDLTSPGANGERPAGLTESFIDNEGFPRGDINILEVKQKRQRLRIINTDYKTLMKQIELLLPNLFILSQGMPDPTLSDPAYSSSSTHPTDDQLALSSIPRVPIAKINQVMSDSPAYTGENLLLCYICVYILYTLMYYSTLFYNTYMLCT